MLFPYPRSDILVRINIFENPEKSFDKLNTKRSKTLERRQEIKVNYKGGLI